MKQKQFYKTLLEFNRSPQKAKECLQDKRLTFIEKKILEGHLLVRNNKNAEVVELLKGLASSEHLFVEAQKKLLLGIALNNLSYFKESKSYLNESAEAFQELLMPDCLFLACFNLFLVHLNLADSQEMKQTLNLLEKIPLEDGVQRLRLLRCRFEYHAMVDDQENAKKNLKELDQKRSCLPENDAISFLVSAFMFHVKLEEFTKCQKLLVEMKKHRKYHLTENYNFMKKLLDHYVHNDPIYAYDHDFQQIPILFHQLKVIQQLEEGNDTSAREYWKLLQDVSPGTYLDEFQYRGEKCLFSLCLEKHLQVKKDDVVVEISAEASKLDILIHVLTVMKAPVLKEHLYQHLWGALPLDKDDLKKLTKLVSRARSERNIEIKTRKGTYYIEKEESQAKSGQSRTKIPQGW